MQGRELRYAVLIGLLLVGAGLFATISEPAPAGPNRWPTSQDVFAVDQWTSGASSIEEANGSTYVTRPFHRADGADANLTIITNRSAKVFGAGPDVAFQGAGYEIVAAPRDLTGTQVDGFLATRGSDQWLVLYAYGERRGLLGSGWLGWGTAVLDGVLGHENDYYRIFLVSPFGSGEADGKQIVALAQTLFPRIAAWYAAPASA
jgi:hypothetical protein